MLRGSRTWAGLWQIPSRPREKLMLIFPNLRIFRSAREHWHEPLKENRDRLAKWKPCDPKSAAETSAVAHYFGKTLQQKLGVPVGIIQRAYAGTPIEGWMPWYLQENDPRARQHKEDLDQTANRLISRGQTKQKSNRYV